MGKFGKRNQVSRNLFDYNLCLLGEPGIGKTTLMFEVCEKIAPEQYIIFNMGKEDGVSALNAIYENIESWKKFDEVTKDIIKNKDTDYADLKVIIIDTVDQLFEIAEPEVIRRYNQEKMGEKNFKPVKTINAAYGGFGSGLDQTIKLVLDKIWELKSAGVVVWMCGHTKTKDIIDPVTDQTFTTISSNLSQKYFNAIKTKMHVIGMAVIDRDIVTESTGRKNIVTKEEITKNKVTAESRKIIFRDDNYGVDSKSRFAGIVNEIPLNSDAFINAIQDAINEAASGNTVSTTIKKKATPKKKIEPVVEEPEEEPESEVEQFEDEEEFMNPPEEATSDDFDDDDLRTEIRKMNRMADGDTKKEVKRILNDNGVKLNEAERDVLDEIYEVLKSA